MNSVQLGKKMLIYTAAALFACAIAIAQQPGMSQQPDQQPAAPGSPNNPATPGTGMAGMPDNPNMQSFADQSFLRKTLEDDQAQVQMGQLAAQKSPSDDVKQFGEKMAQIHQQLTDQLKPIAKKLNVDEPKGPSKKDKQEIEKMQALSGPDFDAAFIKAMMKDQQSDLKEFNEEAQTAQDPNVMQLAKADGPVLNQHLQLLQQLAQAHNVTLDSKK